MIDLKEPVRRQYSEEEGREVAKSFLLLLFLFLAFYLSLHNLFIPLSLNLFRENYPLFDVHYWFLFSLPLAYFVKNERPVPRTYLFFLIFGSLSRLILYNTTLYVKNWTIASVFLTEFSLLVYCAFIFKKSYKDKFLLLSICGFFVPYLLSQMEFHSSVKSILFPAVKHEKDLSHEGCKGSKVELHLPSRETIKNFMSIQKCGFADNRAYFGKNFSITNELGHLFHLRLFKLQHKEGKVFWKFVRLLKVEPSTTLSLNEFLKPDTFFLLKAPERRNLGILVLIPPSTTVSGKIILTPESILKDPL